MWWRSQKAQLTRLSLLVIGRNFEMAANQTFLASGDILPVTHAIRGGGMLGYSQDRCCFNRPDIFVEKKKNQKIFSSPLQKVVLEYLSPQCSIFS
jgi:hypothetical protein